METTKKYPSLQKATKVKLNVIPWSYESIKDGLEYFFELNGRYPTASEIDKFEFLPSARQIQRRFGGLEKLRTQLGYKDINFGKGEFRTKIANQVNVQGRASEIELDLILRLKFGDVYVHSEKNFGTEQSRKFRVDFYVYCPEGNFGVDVFYTKTYHDLQTNINIKLGKYTSFKEQLFFVIANPEFKQNVLDNYINNKSRAVPAKCKLLTLESFLSHIQSLTRYQEPIRE